MAKIKSTTLAEQFFINAGTLLDHKDQGRIFLMSLGIYISENDVSVEAFKEQSPWNEVAKLMSEIGGKNFSRTHFFSNARTIFGKKLLAAFLPKQSSPCLYTRRAILHFFMKKMFGK